MTLIEFFEKTHCNNIYSCLAVSPERIVFAGSDSKDMKRHISDYEKVFAEKGKKCEIIRKTVPKNDIRAIQALLTELVETYDDCVFDITGGNENLIFALGFFCGKNSDKKIQVHSFNVTNDKICDVDGDGNKSFFDIPKLSVRENIMLYGGSCDWDSLKKEETETFKNDVRALFSICRENPRGWNNQMNVLAAIEEIGNKQGLCTRLDREKLKAFLARRKSKIIFNKPIMQSLFEAQLVKEYRHDSNGLVIKYKNTDVRNCLTKAGLVLELAVYLTAKECRTKDGTPIYNDAATGVVIDWDGKDLIYDTKNEIDVLLMHGITPIFISCKNGYVSVDELYKLSTVAQRFGGDFAKKVLVAADLDTSSENGKFLVSRARDMGIEMICGEHDLRGRQFGKKLENLYRC